MHKLTRRNVIVKLTGTGAALMCPAILNAQTVDLEWDGIPTTTPVGQDRLINVDAGASAVEISALQAGEVAVIARPTTDETYSSTGMIQYIAVHHRTADQIAFGEANDQEGTVQNSTYFVVNLVCDHRGKAIGITGDPNVPFACTDRGSRHSSNYNASGIGVSGASAGDSLSFPDYTLAVDGDQIVLQLA